MPYSSRFVVVMPVLILLMCGQTVRSQSTEKFEVGGQFSVMQLSAPARATIVSTTIAKERETQLGFGGRIAYNVSNNVAVEAEVNFFPNADTFGNDFYGDGNSIQGLFGAKVGKRFEKVGVFAKARPGFLSASHGDLEEIPGIGCLLIFPPPAGCFEPVRKTHFAFDIGGVVEVYPTKRTIIRFDAGDTIIRFSDRRVPVVFSSISSSFVGAMPVTAETTHNFQASIGVAYRF